MAVSSLPVKRQKAVEIKSRKKDEKASTSSITTFAAQLSTIEASLSASSDLNPLYDLIQLLQNVSLDNVDLAVLKRGIKFLVRSLQALLGDHRIPLSQVNERGLVQGSFRSDTNMTEADHAVADWLRQRWNEAIQLLCDVLMHSEADARLLALSSLMALQRDASSQLCIQLSSSTDDRPAQWSSSPWNLLTSTLIAGSFNTEESVPQDVITAFAEDYLEQYDDVRYAFCREVSNYLRSPSTLLKDRQNMRANAIAALWGLTAIPTKEEDLNNFLIKELQDKKPTKKASSKKQSGEKKDDDDEDEEVEDWFSDSDDENPSSKRKNSADGLGKAAQSAAAASHIKRQRKKNPPFREAVYSLNAQKAIFSKAWLSVLLPVRREDADGKMQVVGGSLSLAMMHEALVRMHSQIMPHLVKPNLLHDFLVDCLDAGGATSLLALNALFSLITTHNLNYPSFYLRLYGLLRSDPPFLHVRYRSRFLRLLDVFLSSTHLPAALVASFAKRLSRVALRAPPAAIVVVIPFVWNLCKRHKSCLGLLHREFGGDRFDQGPAGIDDPFDDMEPDPLKTGAINSSLWELAAMGASVFATQETSLLSAARGGEMHYLGSVASLSKILAEPFTKERYDLEDFLDLTYSTMFETETAKTLKKREGKRVTEPALQFALPSRNGKRLSILGSSEPMKEEATKKRRLGDDEALGEQEEELAMKEVQDNDTKVDDACSRFFSF
jgi:U3 small nucleolar RNA-associated protein 19